MSILGNIANILLNPDFIVLWAAIAFSTPLAIKFGLFRPRAIVGPIRLADEQSVFPLAISLFMAFAAMVLVAAFYGTWRHPATAGPGQKPAPLDIVDKAFLFSVPPLASVATLIIVDLIAGGPNLLNRVGISARKIPAGFAWGVLAAIIVVPPTYVVSLLTELLYRWIHFEHPGEHELLTLLHEQSPHLIARWVLVVAATLIAPLSEEMLFRGHLQTVIKRMLEVVSVPARPRPQPGFPVIQAGFPLDPAPAELPPMAVAVSTEPRPALVWQAWVAVVITSCLFAAMHDRWMWPPIFFLRSVWDTGTSEQETYGRT